MESYILLLVVTSEQEAAIELLFSQRKWRCIKPAVTEAVSSHLASLNSEIQQGSVTSDTRHKTVDEIYNLANEVASDICRNMDFNTNLDIKSECMHIENTEKHTPESNVGAASIVVKQEDTTTSGSDTEIETYDLASFGTTYVDKSDNDGAALSDDVKSPCAEMEDNLLNSVSSDMQTTGAPTVGEVADEDTELVESSYRAVRASPSELETKPSTSDKNPMITRTQKACKRKKEAKFKRGSKKRSRSYLEVRKLLKKRTTGKQVSNTANKSKASKGEKTDRCLKCKKFFTHSQFVIHEAKDRCQLICCYCGKNFGDNFARYNRHIRNVHTSANLATNLPLEEKDDGLRPEPSDRDSKDLPVSGAYRCSVCGTSYVSLVRYTSHVEKGNCKKTCEECGKVFLNNPQNFLIHTRTHSKSLQFPCNHCPKSFVTQAKLQRHMKEHTGGVFTCHKCPMTFNLQSHLSNHQKVAHTCAKQYCCDLCGVVYKSIGSLKYHNDTSHSDHRPFSCHICEARFKVKVTLKAHMQVHTDFKNYQCSKCYKQFKTRTQLRNHERRHTMRFSHTCDVCFKGFYDKRTLTDHKNIHSGDKPYKCTQCAYACASMGNLVKHKKIHYPVLVPPVRSGHQQDMDTTRQHFIGSMHQQDVASVRQEMASVRQQDMVGLHQQDVPRVREQDMASMRQHDISSICQHDMASMHQHDIGGGHVDVGGVRQHDLGSGRVDMGGVHQHDIGSAHQHKVESGHKLDIGSGRQHDSSSGGHQLVMGGGQQYDLGTEQHAQSSMLAAHRDYLQSNLY